MGIEARPARRLADTESSDAPALDASEDLQWLRASLELGMGELAELFGVSRKAAWDWLGGAKTPKASRIRAVRALVESRLPAESRPFLRQFWSHSPTGGEPLAEIIKSGKPSRLPKEASAALADLKGPIAAHAKRLAAEALPEPAERARNADLYRSL